MPKNIIRKYSGKLGDSSELDAKIKKERESHPPASPAAGKEPGKDYPFELLGGFGKALSEAKGLVKKVKEGRKPMAEPSESEAPKHGGEAGEADAPAALSPGFLRWGARVALLAAIAFLGYSTFIALAVKEPPPPECEDILVRIENGAPYSVSVKDYVKYIVEKASKVGMEGIDGKWVEGVPPSFKEAAKAKLELLGTGFSIAGLRADKVVVYVVECHPDINPAKTVFVEVVKGRLPSGSAVFRLQKVY